MWLTDREYLKTFEPFVTGASVDAQTFETCLREHFLSSSNLPRRLPAFLEQNYGLNGNRMIATIVVPQFVVNVVYSRFALRLEGLEVLAGSLFRLEGSAERDMLKALRAWGIEIPLGYEGGKFDLLFSAVLRQVIKVECKIQSSVTPETWQTPQQRSKRLSCEGRAASLLLNSLTQSKNN